MQKYLAALLHIAIVLSGAVAAVIDKPITLTVALQLAVLAAGSVVTYLVPLLAVRWQSVLKTLLGGVLPTIVAAAVPFIPGLSGHVTAQNVIPVIAAVLAALGTELGVSARADANAASPQPNLDSGEPADAAAPAAVPEAAAAPALS